MDGVPVKISEKYKPRKKISLPGSVLNKISALKDATIENYDFSFERSVIDKISQYREEALEKKKKEEQQKIEEPTEQLSAESSPGTPPSPVSLSRVDSTNLPSQSTVSQTHILTPMPVYDNPVRHIQRGLDNAFISEFESDTSSPFDNMELKSINDLQELADVLGSTSGESKPVPLPNGVTSHWNNNYYSLTNQFYPLYTECRGVGGYTQFSTNMAATSSQQNAYTLTTNVSPPYSGNYIPPVPPKPASMSTYNPPPTCQFFSPSAQSSANSIANSNSQACSPDLSTSNLWTGLQSAIISRRTFESPVSTTASGHAMFVSTAVKATMDEKPLENPYSSLSSNNQVLAKKMSEMGFPLARAARVVRFFNGDEARVIEFLLQIQKFEDQSFPGDRVEAALISTAFDEKEALKYLENTKKLMDLGFSESQVIDALRQSKNDPDRALDALIS